MNLSSDEPISRIVALSDEELETMLMDGIVATA